MENNDDQKGVKIRPVQALREEHEGGSARIEDALVTNSFDAALRRAMYGNHYVYGLPLSEQGGGSDIPRPLLEPETKVLMAQYDEYSAIPMTVEEHEEEILVKKRFMVLPLTNPYAKGKMKRQYSPSGEKIGEWFVPTPLPWSPHGEPVEFTAPVDTKNGEDPHVAFFMAAHDLRDYIWRATQALDDEIKLWGYDNMRTVTLVRTAICAIPLEREGMELYCSIEQYAVDETGIMNKDAALSTMGEIPIRVPGGIELQQLIGLEEDLIKRGVIMDAFKDRPYLEQRIRELNRRRVQIAD